MKILRGFAYTLAASFLSVSLLYAAGRTGLLNSYLQSDLDAMDNTSVKHFIINLAGIQAPQSNMIYVDSNSAVGHDSGVYIGVRSTTMPFATLSAAHAAASAGDRIICRPGSNTASTSLTISKRLTIDAYGFKLLAAAKTNTTKLNITAADVTINGLEVDGIGTPERTLTDVVLNSTSTATSSTGAFTSGDVGRLLTFRSQKNAFAGITIASVTNSTTIVGTAAFGATATGVNMEIWAGDPNAGAIEVTGARCHLNDVYVHDYISVGIRLSAGCDGFRAFRCHTDNCHQGINGTNYSATPIYDVVIEGCSATRNRYDSYRLSDEGWTGTGAAYRGCKIINNTSRDAGNFGAELFGNEAASDTAVDGNYFANNGLGGISMAATNHSSASNNKIHGFYGMGIEWAENKNRSYNSCQNNIIEEANEDGTYQPIWQTGISGLSISDNGGGGAQAIKLQVQGNTIVVPNGVGVQARQVSGIYCKNNYTYTLNDAYHFQSPTGDIVVENSRAEIISDTAYAIWVDTSAQTSTGFHFRNNKLNHTGAMTVGAYSLFQFYASDAPHTINDLIIDGTRTNMTYGGSGFHNDGGNVLNFVSMHDNMPQATFENGQVGFPDSQRFYDINVTSSIQSKSYKSADGTAGAASATGKSATFKDGLYTAGAVAGDTIQILDSKAASTDGGTFTSGSWQTRDLNTIRTDSASRASVSSNQFTLSAGTYRYRITAPGFQVGNHQARLYNVTDSAVVNYGTCEYSPTGGAQTTSIVSGRFTISGSKTFRVEHRCGTTASTSGYGAGQSFGTENDFTQVELTAE